MSKVTKEAQQWPLSPVCTRPWSLPSPRRPSTAIAGAPTGWRGCERSARSCTPAFDRRADALMELCDGLLGAAGPVASVAHLSLEPDHRRGWASGYAALRQGRINPKRLRKLLAGLEPLHPQRPLWVVDVSGWPRPEAATSPERRWCHDPKRRTHGKPVVAGWPFSLLCGVGLAHDSWTQPLDVARLGPHDHAGQLAAAQVRALAGRVPPAQLKARPLVLLDSHYDPSQLQCDLADVNVQLLVRVRSNRCFYFDPPPRRPGQRGRPRRHGHKLKCNDPATWPPPAASWQADTTAGRVRVACWRGVHPKQRQPGQWPIVRGSLLQVQLDRHPGPNGRRRPPQQLWLWWAGLVEQPDLELAFQAYLRRFAIEHTIRYDKQQLSWTTPRLRSPQQAERWTWLVLAAFAQLGLARGLVGDQRLPWQRPQPATRRTPTRVRHGFWRVRLLVGTPARAPKPRGRPPGRARGQRIGPAPRYRVQRRGSQPRAP
jgi:hypothetical protein